MTYKILYLYDEWYCETCGPNYASGYHIYKDDVLVVDKSPSAHCYSSVDFDQSDAAFDILELEGISFSIEHEGQDEGND